MILMTQSVVQQDMRVLIQPQQRVLLLPFVVCQLLVNVLATLTTRQTYHVLPLQPLSLERVLVRQ
jgi:hypothetical protein